MGDNSKFSKEKVQIPVEIKQTSVLLEKRESPVHEQGNLNSVVFSLCLSYSTWNFEIELVLGLRSGGHLQEESHPRTPWCYLPDYKKKKSKIESLYPSHSYPDANSGTVFPIVKRLFCQHVGQLLIWFFDE